LDLGAGVGSVGLSTLWRLDERATLRCVEAQAVSHELCRRTVAANGLDDRVSLERGDLRDFDGLRGYDVVTGSPPYIDPRKGVPSRHDQKAFCRLEFRGGLDDYLAAAARALAPGGAFAYVMAAADDRNDVCPPRHGLVVTRRVDVVFKLGRKPHICICVCERAADDATPAAERETLVLRDADGRRTRDYRVWQERTMLPRDVPEAAVRNALDGLDAARDARDLRRAIAAAEAVGLRATPGSEEMCRAKAALATMRSAMPDSSSAGMRKLREF